MLDHRSRQIGLQQTVYWAMIYLRMQVKFITMYKCDVFAMFLLLLLYHSLLSKYYAITLQATTTEQQQLQQQRTRTHRLCPATRQAGRVISQPGSEFYNTLTHWTVAHHGYIALFWLWWHYVHQLNDFNFVGIVFALSRVGVCAYKSVCCAFYSDSLWFYWAMWFVPDTCCYHSWKVIATQCLFLLFNLIMYYSLR